MNIDSINRRLDKLDARHPAETPRRVIRLIVAADDGETPNDAIARWRAENPNEPPPSDADFIILRSLVSPNAKHE
jgi:hypothetical protein